MMKMMDYSSYIHCLWSKGLWLSAALSSPMTGKTSEPSLKMHRHSAEL